MMLKGDRRYRQDLLIVSVFRVHSATNSTYTMVINATKSISLNVLLGFQINHLVD